MRNDEDGDEWNAHMITLTRSIFVAHMKNDGPKFYKKGKSEGFESYDQPIVRKRTIYIKIGDVLSHVTVKFDG